MANQQLVKTLDAHKRTRYPVPRYSAYVEIYYSNKELTLRQGLTLSDFRRFDRDHHALFAPGKIFARRVDNLW